MQENNKQLLHFVANSSIKNKEYEKIEEYDFNRSIVGKPSSLLNILLTHLVDHLSKE